MSLSGWVTRMQSGFYTVQVGSETLVCHVRKRLKRGKEMGDLISIGDRVEVSRQPDGSGMIEEILPRQRALIRLDPTPRGVVQQILLANPDQVLLVFSCAQPAPHLRMLDRFLVIAEKDQIPAAIVASKVDLVGEDAAHSLFGLYESLGYPVFYTSVQTGSSIAEVKAHLLGKITGLAGPSGVGKSSLLNAIQPDLGLAVREVSAQTTKGRHTTVVRQMFPLAEGGFVADLPGLRSLALWDTEPEELDGYFVELRDLVAHCQFSDCTHRTEPGCAVRQAVSEGKIHPERYASYLRLRYGND
ncbi:MAG TPA: ribosome small subunit-dependent GTPase A [Anaerolineaceae bacterium]